MEKALNLPEIEGVKWMTSSTLDIISIAVTLESKGLKELGLKDVPSLKSEIILDLSKLAGLRPYFPTELEVPSSSECIVDVEGLDSFVADVSLEEMIELWIFYKINKNVT